jgi:hypothetical protein
MKRKETEKLNGNIMWPHSPVLLPKQYDFFHIKLLELKRQSFCLLWRKALMIGIISVAKELNIIMVIVAYKIFEHAISLPSCII